MYSHVELLQRSVVDNVLRNSGDDLVQKCRGRVWTKSVVQRCWRKVLYRSVAEEKENVIRRNGGEECCREVLQEIGEKCRRESCCTGVLEESVVE